MTVEAWAESRNRTMRGGRADRAELPRGENGRILCRWCSLETPRGRVTFCSDWCVHEWRLRTDPGYLRAQVLARDKGVCAACGFDALAEWRRIQRLPRARREGVLRDWGLGGRRRFSLWDADHVKPVAEGGGECDLENLRTLCLRCHAKATAQLRARLKSRAEPEVR